MTLAAAGAAAQTRDSDLPVGKSVQPCPLDTAYLEIALTHADGSPLGEVEYSATDQAGHKHAGRLDKSGKARLDAVRPGFCQVTFDSPLPDDPKPVPGAKGRHFRPGQPLSCKTGEPHLFYVADWGATAMEIDHLAAAATAVKPLPAELPPADPADEEGWDLTALEEKKS